MPKGSKTGNDIFAAVRNKYDTRCKKYIMHTEMKYTVY